MRFIYELENLISMPLLRGLDRPSDLFQHCKAYSAAVKFEFTALLLRKQAKEGAFQAKALTDDSFE